jgi:hypothetical protein
MEVYVTRLVRAGDIRSWELPIVSCECGVGKGAGKKIGAKKVEGRLGAEESFDVISARGILRVLFFGAMTGSLAGWVLFTALDVDLFYRGILTESGKLVLLLAAVSFFLLPLVSIGLRGSDRGLANIGFGTFFGVLLLTLVFRRLID